MNKKVLKITGLFLIITAIYFLLFDSWFTIKHELYDTYIVDNYIQSPNIINIPQIDNLTEDVEDQVEIKEPIYEESFIAILEIPKINLKRGLVDKNSKNNNVDQNIMTLPISTMPDIEKGNLVLAAHSGVGYHAFFKHLYKLSTNDLIYIYYNNIKYDYKIIEIYHEIKDGTVALHKNIDDTTLTLITCKYKDKTKQTIYIATLVKKEVYLNN